MFQIRKMELQDVAAVATVHINSWQIAYAGQVPKDYIDQYTHESRKRMWTNIFNDPIETVYVAELSGQLIGFINYGPCFNKKHDESIKELRALYLCPEYFSKG